MALKAVKKVLVSDGVVEQIQNAIHEGELTSGQKLMSEAKLSQHLSVSRSSLREALNALIHLGYLYRKKKALYVSPESRWQGNSILPISRSKEEYSIAEMIEVRKIVETKLCALAAQRAEAEDIDALKECLDNMKEQVIVNSGFIESDHQFHLCIAKAAKNSIMVHFLMKIQVLLKKTITLILEKSSISQRSLTFHEQIFEAIRDGDPNRARHLMEEHLDDIEKEFIKILYQTTKAE